MAQELCFGQRYDDTLGILEPWYVNTCMDRIKEMDLSDKVIMEWGMGSSTVWWANKTKLVLGVDHNREWYNKVVEEIKLKGLEGRVNIGWVDTHEGDISRLRDSYVKYYDELNNIISTKTEFNKVEKVDIAIVDGVHRYECAEYAVNILKPKVLIIDNHQQDYVFMCPKLDDLLKGVKMERFVQANHIDHSGNPWATAIFYFD